MAFAPPPVSPQWLSKREIVDTLLLTGAIALCYGAAAQFSLQFATLPSHVAAVWFPSALTLALFFNLGVRAVPGIVLGSMFALLEIFNGQDLPYLYATLLNLICALANVVQPWLARTIILRQIPLQDLFTSIRSSLVFMQAAILAPTVSAFLGITTHCIVGAIPWQDYGITWLAWWLASALAHLVFSPPLLLWQEFMARDRDHRPSLASYGVLILFFIAVIVSFKFGHRVSYVLLPMFLCLTVSHGRFFSSVLVAIISFCAILATRNQSFIFLGRTPNETLLLLQIFMASIAITSLILSLSIYDRQRSQLVLQETLKELEERVLERTSALRTSQAQLSGFFSSSPIGMGIVDRQFRLIQFNRVLLEILQIYDHQSIQPLTDLEHNLGILVRHISQVLRTGQPLLNQEFQNCLKSVQDMTQPQSLIEEFYRSQGWGDRAWILSYFPIFDDACVLHQVGFMVIDISERKRLEHQLQQQACRDGLTKIANRRFFDQVFQEEWQRAIARQSPLGILLCDADYFKNYNDTYGHQKGDQCLIRVAQILQRHGRSGLDLAARYGGEEFVLLLPNLPGREVLAVADRICAAIRQVHIPHRASAVSDRVTLSIGVVVAVPQGTDTAAAFLHGADRALYEAKRQGRDRVVQLPFPAAATPGPRPPFDPS